MGGPWKGDGFGRSSFGYAVSPTLQETSKAEEFKLCSLGKNPALALLCGHFGGCEVPS